MQTGRIKNKVQYNRKRKKGEKEENENKSRTGGKE
jgi:hypothetical protein